MAGKTEGQGEGVSVAGILPAELIRLHCLRLACDTTRGTPASVPDNMIVDRAKSFELFVTAGASGCAGDGTTDDPASRPK